MGIRDEHALPIAIHDMRGHTHDSRVWRHICEHYRSSAYARILAHGDVAQNIGVVADENTVTDGRMTLSMALARAAQSDALIDRHAAANDGRFPDHDSCRMIDKEPPPQQSAGHRFRVVLAGPEMPNFRAFWQGFARKDRVTRLGVLSEDEKRDFFAGIDLFALPSRCESERSSRTNRKLPHRDAFALPRPLAVAR